MEIYNTLTRKKELLEPRKDKKINMFVCGPTVYDYIHIGNARTFVFFDVVAKYLRYRGYEVDYIQNITDIDNKIIERAQKEGVDPLEYAKKYSDIFKQDMQALGVTSPKYKNATDHIPEVIKQVKTLLDKSNAYIIENDGIYFDLSTFPDYGKLSGRTSSMADDAVSRIDDSDKKRNRGDFAIWKFSAPGDPSWSAPFGDGRPGWHIEDTAITEKYFGPQYDIHGGGQDLIFPHHEAEIAQQESASGLKPFVKYWMHVGFIVNKEQKMSKSLGNFETLNELLKKYPKEILRFYLLSGNYRQPLDYSQKVIEQFNGAIHRLSSYYDLLKKIDSVTTDNLSEIIENKIEKFYSSMDDDFNIPSALATVFELISDTYPTILERKISKLSSKKIINFVDEVNNIFDIIRIAPKNIRESGKEIDRLRSQKKFEKATSKRIELENKGYIIENTIHGTTIIPGIIIKKSTPDIKVYRNKKSDQK